VRGFILLSYILFFDLRCFAAKKVGLTYEAKREVGYAEPQLGTVNEI